MSTITRFLIDVPKVIFARIFKFVKTCLVGLYMANLCPQGKRRNANSPVKLLLKRCNQQIRENVERRPKG